MPYGTKAANSIAPPANSPNAYLPTTDAETKLTCPSKKCHTTRPLPRGILTPAKLQPLRFGAAASREGIDLRAPRGSCFFVWVEGMVVRNRGLTKTSGFLLSYGFGSGKPAGDSRYGGLRIA